MNKLFLLMSAGLMAMGAVVQGGEVRELPAPAVSGGMPLMQAINERHSQRAFDPSRAVDDQTLSQILWVAWGMNEHGKRTIPTGRNLQNMALYVLTPEGVWLYDAAGNKLEKVNDKNLIPLCDKQPFVKDAAVHLVYVAKDDKWGKFHIGSAYQNVYLYATSKGLATVIRGMCDTEGLTREIGLPEGEKAFLHQVIGWPAPEEK